MGWSLVLPWDRFWFPCCEADSLGLRESKSVPSAYKDALMVLQGLSQANTSPVLGNKELMKWWKRLAQPDEKNSLLLNSADSCHSFYFLGLNLGYFAQSGRKSHFEITQWILAIRNALIEKPDTATAIKRNMPEMISLPQKLMSLLEDGTIISSSRHLQLALLNTLFIDLFSTVVYRRAWGRCDLRPVKPFYMGREDGECQLWAMPQAPQTTPCTYFSCFGSIFLHRTQEFECGDYILLPLLEGVERNLLWSLISWSALGCCLGRMLLQPLQAW